MLSRVTVVRVVSRTYVELLRGTSEVVQLFWIFFALPVLVGYRPASQRRVPAAVGGA